MMPDRWRDSLPPTLADTIDAVLPELTDQVVDAVRSEVPEYRRPMEGRFGRNVRVGVDRAFARFAERIRDPARPEQSDREIYVGLGRGEFRDGRTMEALLSAYRTGARVAWRRISAAALADGFDAATIAALGEAIFEYIDGLSSESADGYAQAQAEAAGELETARSRLIELIGSADPADPATVAAAAERARFRPPAEVAAIAVATDEPGRVASLIDDGAIGGQLGESAMILVGDPSGPGRLAAIERRLGEMRAAVGPAVPWEAARDSIHQALLGLQLASATDLKSPIHTDAHLTELILASAAGLARRLSQRELAPFDSLTPGARERLRQTLRAWLDEQGRTEPTARALGIHPQTVRYRLRQLRELLGDLDDPERRLALALALRTAA